MRRFGGVCFFVCFFGWLVCCCLLLHASLQVRLGLNWLIGQIRNYSVQGAGGISAFLDGGLGSERRAIERLSDRESTSRRR